MKEHLQFTSAQKIALMAAAIICVFSFVLLRWTAANADFPYEVGADGKTYGSLLYANGPEDAPDYILVETADGVQGYVSAADFYGDLAETPEEALARHQGNARSAESKSVPVYAEDGETIIGSFEFDSVADCLDDDETMMQQFIQ